MKLLKVKTSKIPGRVWLIFEDKTYLPFSVDDWVKLDLVLPADVDLNLITDIMFSFLLKSYALNQIALSPKVSAILVPKLRQKSRLIFQKYQTKPNDLDRIITGVIEYLEQRNLLNESDYVDYVLRHYSHKSKGYITQYLRSKKINPHNYLQLTQKSDRDLLVKLLQTPKYQIINTVDFKTRQKLIASLIRKGFAYDDIKSLIDS